MIRHPLARKGPHKTRGSRARAGLLLASLLALPGPGCGEGEVGWQPGINAPAGQRSTLSEGRFLPLSTTNEAILDAEGRQVILRGLQHHALQDVDYKGREVEKTDYALMASWGFTTLRMAISWSRVEPSRGSYSAAYLAQVKEAMDLARQAGLTVILEWHQDLWGRCSVDKSSSFAANANGAPDWTCPGDYKPSALGYWNLFDNLWANTDSLQERFVQAWLHVIDKLGRHPALAGYDLLNEPAGNGGSPSLERDKIFPALRAIIPKLRARAGKALFVIDAPLLRNETYKMYAEPLDTIGPGLVFAPHLYSGWMSLYMLGTPIPDEEKKQDFTLAKEQARKLRLPLWNGEWGVNLNLQGALEDLAYHVSLEEAFVIGSSYWAFQRAVPGQGDASISGAQSLLESDRTVRREVVDILSRPYPIQTPGTLEQLAWDPKSRTLVLRVSLGKPSSAPLVLFAPVRHLSGHICLEVSGPGAWSFDYRAASERVLVRLEAAGRYQVSLRPCCGEKGC